MHAPLLALMPLAPMQQLSTCRQAVAPMGLAEEGPNSTGIDMAGWSIWLEQDLLMVTRRLGCKESMAIILDPCLGMTTAVVGIIRTSCIVISSSYASQRRCAKLMVSP